MTYADIKNLSDRLAELHEINGQAPMPSHTTALLLLDEVEELREYIEGLQTNTMTHSTNTDNPIDFPKVDMDPVIQHLAESAGFNFDEHNEVLQRKVELLVELIGQDILELTNSHGNIKPREVKKYFGVTE